MRARFPLFNSACDLAQSFWRQLLKEGDSVIDATLGNGHDALFLADIVLRGNGGFVYGFDIQETAIENTWKLLTNAFSEEDLKRVILYLDSHDKMDKNIVQPVKLVVYNLGYLPGGNKGVTTSTGSTLESVQQGMSLLAPGGALSIVCYPGHREGEKEEKALADFFSKAPAHLWSVSHMRFLNRQKAPSVLIVQKNFLELP